MFQLRNTRFDRITNVLEQSYRNGDNVLNRYGSLSRCEDLSVSVANALKIGDCVSNVKLRL